MATAIQQSIELINEIFQNEADGTNDIELETNFDIFENFAQLTINIINHYGGKLEHLISDSNAGFSLILINGLYIMVEYERRQNRSYDFTFRSFYFISTAENYIFGDKSPELDEEPTGVIEDS